MRFLMACRSLGLGTALATTLLLFAPTTADAACRTETCQLPSNFSPGPDSCSSFGPTCTMPDGAVYQNLLVFWRSACVGYSVQQDASKYVTLPDFEAAAAGAFATWTGAMCGTNPVGLAVHFLGPVACAETKFKASGPNQHQMVFRDDVWPYDAPGEVSATVALTTVTYNVDTGELYDATVELNTADHMIVVAGTAAGSDASTLPADAFDLQSVLTHEAGHFLGLAHTADSTAVMFASRDQGVSGLLRALLPDDVTAICSAYPGDGTRIVSPSVADGGVVAEGTCDWSVAGGFSSSCTAPPVSSHGCALAVLGTNGEAPWALPAGAMAAVLVAWGRRRRGSRRFRSPRL